MADAHTSEAYASLRSGIMPRVAGLRRAQTNIRAEGLGIRAVFRVCIVVLAAAAFCAIVGVSCVRVTQDEFERSSASVRSEVNYLSLQLKSLGERSKTFKRTMSSAGVPLEQIAEADPEGYRSFTDPVGDVLEGYTLAETGTVLIAREDEVIASDDERIPVGASLRESLGADIHTQIDAILADAELRSIPLQGALSGSSDASGYLMAGEYGDYTIVIVEPESMVFRNRASILGREATATFFVLLVVACVVDRLLAIAVARRIDGINKTLEEIVSGDLDARVVSEGTREFRSLANGINVTVDALQGWIGEAERRMDADLATARRIQEGALPRQFPAFPDVGAVDLFASMDSAREVGGDFYDFFKLDENSVAFLIADVSGKGIPGGLFMMAAKTEIENHLRAGLGLVKAVATANEALCANNEAGMFVTVWAATLDWRTGELTYVNAGHNFPLLRHEGKWEWIKKRCGLFLGTFETAKYREEKLMLEPGDELLLYTDGVNEAFNVEEEEYGNKRLEQFLTNHADLAPRDLVPALRADVVKWARGAEQSDDVTILALEYSGSQPQ